MNKISFLALVCVLQLTLWSCDNNVLTPNPALQNPSKSIDSSLLKGTGNFIFSSFSPLSSKPIDIFYHIPITATDQTPILFAFHGSERDGNYSRTALIDEADGLNFIVIAPQFSELYYPGGDSYNLGNIFQDGDNPSSGTLNSEEIWSFSVIEPLFDAVKKSLGSKVEKYDVFGHSAGAQFVHRYLIYKPQARVRKAVSASSGWYTMLDNAITFPYGLKASPAEAKNLSNLFAQKLFIIVGEKDTDENSFGLRHNDIVDKQGLHRFDRAQYFYTNSQAYALADSTLFNWQYLTLPNVGHDYIATSAAAALLLYP